MVNNHRASQCHPHLKKNENLFNLIQNEKKDQSIKEYNESGQQSSQCRPHLKINQIEFNLIQKER